MDVDTRSDIYSLGALLYELLSGCPPFDPAELRKSGVEEIRQMLRDVEPCRPSAAVDHCSPDELGETAARRNCEPQKLAGKIRGDLDRIVMKAMAKDRQHRYSSADVLAADIVCYLNHEPISARPPGRFYRLGKLVRRNKVVFAAGTLVVLSLVLGLGAATVMFLRANQAREAAELARANEAALRRKAEIGQAISHAAVLLKYGKIAEADALLADISPADARPSLETAQIYRQLGLWHARENRWEQAAERFAALAYSLASADKTDTEVISIDLQPAASSLCEAGDLEGYERLRNMLAARFDDSSNSIVAEQVVKVCLLKPATTEFLARLSHLEDMMIAAHASTPKNTAHQRNLAAWREFAIALMEYRKGNLNQSLDWIEKCTAEAHQNRARDAIVMSLKAMVLHRQNRIAEAEDELAASLFIISERFASERSIFDEGEPFWQDWVNARILLREADTVMGD